MIELCYVMKEGGIIEERNYPDNEAGLKDFYHKVSELIHDKCHDWHVSYREID